MKRGAHSLCPVVRSQFGTCPVLSSGLSGGESLFSCHLATASRLVGFLQERDGGDNTSSDTSGSSGSGNSVSDSAQSTSEPSVSYGQILSCRAVTGQDKKVFRVDTQYMKNLSGRLAASELPQLLSKERARTTPNACSRSSLPCAHVCVLRLLRLLRRFPSDTHRRPT